MQTIVKFIKNILLIDLLKGLWLTLKYTPQAAFTFQYPAERRPTSPRFRGVLRLQTEPGTGDRRHPCNPTKNRTAKTAFLFGLGELLGFCNRLQVEVVRLASLVTL